MTKSPVLRTKEDYKKWFESNRYLTNTFKYDEYNAPDINQYPCIVVADDYYDNHYGRYYLHQEIVELKEFSGVPVFTVEEENKETSDIIGIYTNMQEAGTDVEYRDNPYNVDYRYREFKLNEIIDLR